MLKEDCEDQWLEELPEKLRKRFPDWPGWKDYRASKFVHFHDTGYPTYGNDLEFLEVEDDDDPMEIMEIDEDPRFVMRT